MKIMAIDPGSKRLGVAMTDPSGTIAAPFTVILHISRIVDAGAVANLAEEHGIELILVGQSRDDDGELTFEGRRSGRFAEALKTQTRIPVEMWDESFTTFDARRARIEMGVSRKKRSGHLDELAATILLQSYLEASFKPTP